MLVEQVIRAVMLIKEEPITVGDTHHLYHLNLGKLGDVNGASGLIKRRGWVAKESRVLIHGRQIENGSQAFSLGVELRPKPE